MSNQSTMRYCATCGTKTHHIIVPVKKPSCFEHSTHRRLKESLGALVNYLIFGPFYMLVSKFSKHIICERCGDTVIEDKDDI